VQGCVLNGTTNVTDQVSWAFEITPQDTTGTTAAPVCFRPAGPGSHEGTEIDSDSDHCFEKVKGAQGDAGGNTADQTLYLQKAGSYTITFCEDSNNDASCASETVTASGTKTVKAQNTAGNWKDTLIFASDYNATNNTCPQTFNQISAPANQTVDFQQCVRDSFGNPVAGASVTWRVVSGPGSFTSAENTTDASGNSHATLGNGAAGQQSSVQSVATDSVGNTQTSNTLVVNWTKPTTSKRKSATHLTLGKSSRTRLFGTLSANNPGVCRTGGRLVSLYRDGALINQTTTASGGSFHFRLHKARRRHTFEAKFAGNAHCGASHSNDVASRAR